jgi:hypothetical protein
VTSNFNNSFKGRASVLLAGLVLLTLFASSVIAQETTGSVSGTVTDPSGAAVPNAKVELSGPNLPLGFSTTTDASGTYKISQVPPATGYTVTVTASGFRTVKKTDLAVVLGRSSVLDIKLEVGQITESVVVAADAVLVDTTSSSSIVNVDKTFFDLIPKGRSFYDLVSIAPGARGEGKAGGIQIDGASGSENVYYLDGMEVTNIQTGVLSGQNRIPVEMVQQLQIKNGVMEAQYGGAMGGVVNAVVRSGTNDFHGQAGFYFNNDNMAGRPRQSLRLSPFNDSVVEYFPNVADDYATWNPVFNIGGPLIKNRLFFFSGYAPTRTVTNRTVKFNATQQTGDFSSTYMQHYMTNKLDYMMSSKLRMNVGWIWNPNKTVGDLPDRGGTSDPNYPWATTGQWTAGQILNGQVDYIASSKLIASFRGGYHFTNHNTAYATPNTTAIYYSNNPATAGITIPSNLIAPAGWVVQTPGLTRWDTYTRVNLNADLSYLANWFGQHSIKGGWQMNRLANSVNSQTWANGYYRYWWNLSWTCITSQCSGRQRGAYGYYRYRTIATVGDVSSDNQSLFIQDNWRVNKYLTLNLGLRTEREFLPSFAVDNRIPSRAIEFPWSDKFSPRLGFAWDPKGDGRQRIYASWGYFYDLMKYEMPRGSFGGDIWLDYMYTLEDPNWVNTNRGIPADPTKLPGKFLEVINWRIPSNDPDNYTIDRNLKPMKQRMFDVGYEFSLDPSLIASLRYTNRRLIRTIEDVGTLGPEGEVYYIANPGFGVVADPKTWEAGIPPTPKAVRNYDALEFRLDKRFSKRYQYALSYTWSRQYGNYSGLASSDENGRTSPNVNRFFDLPWIGYTEQGKFSEGRLATDRPHTLKFFGGYSHESKLGTTTLSPNIAIYSGTPLTTEAQAISTVPTFPYGRGDLGRTPIFQNVDLNLMHDFKPFTANEAMRFRFELTVFNLFNSTIITNKDVNIVHPNDGVIGFDHDADIFKGFNTRKLMQEQGLRLSPLYGYANGWNSPRSLRMQVSFFF